MRRLLRQKTDGMWEYTLQETAWEETGFQTMEDYICRQQSTFTQYIATRSLLDLCEGLERAPGAWVEMRWW